MISSELAEQNKLSVGDSFSVKMDEENKTEEQINRMSSHTLEIVGIYQIDSRQVAVSSNTAECDMEENFIFMDTATVRAIRDEMFGKRTAMYNSGAAFFVKNPKELNEIIANLSNLDEYDWDNYAITKNNKTYEEAAVPLERLAGVVTMMVIVILVISFVMLSLILFLWMRERVYEIGVYLSIGIKKIGIVRQHMIENLTIALLAFLIAGTISWAGSGMVEKVVGNTFTEEKTKKNDTLVEVNIGWKELAEVAGIGICIVVLTTGMSSVIVLRMKPREILSTMS